jgi:hypothetical protein
LKPVPVQPARVFYFLALQVSYNGVFLRVHTKFPFRFVGSLIILLSALLFVTCKKDKRVLDTSVQPEGDKFSASIIEEYPVSAYTFPHEDIISFNSKDKFLGTNIDPVFGRTEIGLYLNINLPKLNANYQDAVFLSAEFRLATYNATFLGSPNDACTYSVFPIYDSTLNNKRLYFASNDLQHSKTPLPGTTTGVPVAPLGSSPRMNIALDSTFAKNMFYDTPSMVSNEIFQRAYKGFYILGTPAGGSGQIMKCNLEDPISGLYLFYRANATTTIVDSLRFTFYGDLGVRYNTVKHDYTQAAFSLKNQLGGDTASTDYIYMQGFGGTKARIDIPVKPYVSDSFQLAISRAELILPLEAGLSDSLYKPPPYLSLLAVSSLGKDSLVFDQANSLDNIRYDGVYKAATKQYVFNIARHMQAVVKGQVVNRGFHLVVSDPQRVGTFYRDENVERAVLGGPKNVSLKPTFKLTYSKVSIR